MSAHIVPAGTAAAVVPLVTAHHHLDHHWFVWLPRHPVYESVEVMSIESAGGHCRAVWVFFTEREGGKRQVHFFDDRPIVEHFPGSHFRPIEYERSGTPGQGQSVRVALSGLDDAPIEIAVDLADRPLSRRCTCARCVGVSERAQPVSPMVLSGAASDYETGLARAEDAFETAALDITDTWMILYTSGTTGRPKGARITYGMALFNAVHATSSVALGVDSTNLVFLPTFHAAGLHLYANPILQRSENVHADAPFDGSWGRSPSTILQVGASTPTWPGNPQHESQISTVGIICSNGGSGGACGSNRRGVPSGACPGHRSLHRQHDSE